ncbi:hypothetical protein G9A89_017318 [Geosiphon pyriformis]|nr:hypothetical protein G9A89_017318 [Geosiphon pyriformis]
MPSNLTTPAENLKAKPETDVRAKPSTVPKECTNLTISIPATLGSQKTETVSRNQPLKTKPLNRAIDTEESKTQDNNSCNISEEEKERPESAFQKPT